ncbi:hypothetical protein [Hungatella sp.]|uniref:hypothetical protein n=1 Tax=Hungatella sp. TaxID=2613924 RepID=UPI003993C1F2
MEWTLTDVLVDFAMVSTLLIIAAWLRRKLTFLQRYPIPGCLDCRNTWNDSWTSGAWKSFSGLSALLTWQSNSGSSILSAIVFSCSFLGLKLEKVTGSALQTSFSGWLYSSGAGHCRTYG